MLNVHITLEGSPPLKKSSMIKKPDVCFSRAAGTSRMSGVGIVKPNVILYCTHHGVSKHTVWFFLCSKQIMYLELNRS